MSVLYERRDGGNGNNARPAKRNKTKRNKKQSHPSSTSLSSSGDDSKKKENTTVRVTRNTPTPPPSGPPPPGSPPKRPLPILPSRIPISSSHRRSLGASHKIGSKPSQNPVLPPANAMGARKRSSLSSMRFSPSPSKRRSQFLLGHASSFSSPIRGGGGRASVLSSTPGQPRLPPSYASSQCLPSVDTMASMASASSSNSSVDDTSCADKTDDNSRTVLHRQSDQSIKEKRPHTKKQQQQVFTTPDNTTNNRGAQTGHRGHARLLSELSTTLRLVHEEEDAAAAEQAASSAVSTRTTVAAAGVSS